jgi:hypothetical protein
VSTLLVTAIGGFGFGVLLGVVSRASATVERWILIPALPLPLMIAARLWLEEQGGVPWLLVVPLMLIGLPIVGLTIVGLGYVVGAALRDWRVLRREAFRPLAAYLMVALTVWGIFQVAPLLSRTSDQAMIANFRRHESEFRRLAEMAQEDRRFTRIAPTFTHPSLLETSARNPVAPLPAERWDEYRALFHVTDLRDGVTNRTTHIEFDYWAYGFLDGAAYQGYAYSVEPLSPVVESLQAAKRTYERGKPIYRPIGDGWYLYFWE